MPRRRRRGRAPDEDGWVTIPRRQSRHQPRPGSGKMYSAVRWQAAVDPSLTMQDVVREVRDTMTEAGLVTFAAAVARDALAWRATKRHVGGKTEECVAPTGTKAAPSDVKGRAVPSDRKEGPTTSSDGKDSRSEVKEGPTTSSDGRDSRSASSDDVKEAEADTPRLRFRCYGVGNFAVASKSRRQLAALLLVLDALHVDHAACSIYDPVFVPVEVEALEALGFEVQKTNDLGKHVVTGPTVFFMPHCPMQLYNNLVWANWGERLAQLAIVGNSFATYASVLDEEKRKRDLACVLAVESLVTETKLPLNDDVYYAFNNTSLHTFAQRAVDEAADGILTPSARPWCSQTIGEGDSELLV